MTRQDTYSGGSLSSSAMNRTPRGRLWAPAPPTGGGVVLHYDDGYATDYTLAFPLHAELGLPGISHINSGVIGDAGRLTWDQLREMRDSGLWSVGNHTKDHLSLTSLTATQAREQIEDCFHAILDELGEPPAWFAPPYHAVNKNSEIISYRLHQRERSPSIGPTPAGHLMYPTAGQIQPVDVQRQPNGVVDIDATVDDIFYRAVVRGELVSAYMHQITATHSDDGTNANIGEHELEHFLQSLMDRNIPVIDPRALTWPRSNLLEDGSWEQGGEGWTLANFNGTSSIVTDATDAHSGHSYLRLSNAGAAGSGPNATGLYWAFPLHQATTWRFTCWVRPSRTANTFRVDLRKSYEYAGLSTSNVNLTTGGGSGQQINATDWTKFTTTFDMTGYSHGRLYLEGRSTDGAALTIDVDSMSLTPSWQYDINGDALT